jgi:type 1 glutamine amidotransferase
MHSYRFGNFGKPVSPGADNARWYEYVGVQSTGHDAQEPIDITFVDKDSSITRGLVDWRTIKEELYNNVQILTAKPLAKGKQILKKKRKQADGTETIEEKEWETVVVWTNMYGNTRVFSTSLGHNNQTVEDPRYLDLVTRGVLWATGKLGDDGKAVTGYGPGGK